MRWNMILQSVFDKTFAEYGKVLEGYDFTSLLSTLGKNYSGCESMIKYVASSSVCVQGNLCKDGRK